jgi:hypothetical protein
MPSKYFSELQDVIRRLHGVESKHVESIPVKETFQGKTVWRGVVAWNNAETKVLAESFGAHIFLVKLNLYSELIPAIKHFCPTVSISKP